MTPEVEARQIAALGLARQGFAISQAYGVADGICGCGKPTCPAPGKHGGTGWLEHATTDLDAIRTRFVRGDPNYGVVAPAGSRLLTVDEDVPGSLDALGPLPHTLTVQTGPKSGGQRGRHVYGRLPDGIAESDVPYRWAGGEVRIAGNGHAIGPYSRHYSGVIYTPLNGSTVAELPEAWVRALIASGRAMAADQQQARTESDPGWFVEVGRHNWLLVRAKDMRVAGVDPTDLFEQLTKLDRRRCRPPLTDTPGRGPDEIREIVARVMGKIPEGEAGTVPPDPQDDRPSPHIADRTAADLLYGPPPDQLGDPYLTPEGATCLYGRGGVGKGITACWLVMRLVRAGHVVTVVDFEGHEREWGSRLRGLGMTLEELEHVHYRAPFGPDWTAPTGPLSRVAAAVRDDCEGLGVTYLVVDSYSVATSNGDTMGGEAAAREYFTALATIGLPSLTIAHVKGDSGRFPERPFGSVFVHNLARETWAVERVGDDDPEDDPDLIRFGPHVVSLELRNRKANGRAKAAAQFVTFSFFADGSIEVSTDRAGRAIADLAADVLGDGPLTAAKMRAAIKEDTGQDVTADALRVTMKRDARRFEQASTGRPRTWSLR